MFSEITTGQNSCCHYDLTHIKENEDVIVFPEYYLEDYYIDYFTEHNIPYKYSKESVIVNKKDISWDTLYLLKTNSYSAINWYEELQEFTYPSEFIEISNVNDIKSLKKTNNIFFPKFVKLDTVSCKDTGHNGIFNSFDHVYKTFIKSSRIINTLFKKDKSHYLFIRQPDFDINNKLEARCFIYQYKLTAVSLPLKNNCEFQWKTPLETFIKEIIKKLPFHDAVLDISIGNNNDFTLIEVNNFGADSPCGAGLFNWREDYITLYGGFDEVVYKYF